MSSPFFGYRVPEIKHRRAYKHDTFKLSADFRVIVGGKKVELGKRERFKKLYHILELGEKEKQ